MATIKTYVEAGRLVRGSVKSGLMKSAFAYGVGLDLREDKGFLGSTYYVTATGTEHALGRWHWAVRAWLHEAAA